MVHKQHLRKDHLLINKMLGTRLQKSEMRIAPEIINQSNSSGWCFHDQHQLYLKDECCHKAGVMPRLIPDKKLRTRLSSLSEGAGGSANRKQAHKNTARLLIMTASFTNMQRQNTAAEKKNKITADRVQNKTRLCCVWEGLLAHKARLVCCPAWKNTCPTGLAFLLPFKWHTAYMRGRKEAQCGFWNWCVFTLR